MRKVLVWSLGLATAASVACGDANLFTVEDDIDLGQQLSDEIAASPEDYPVIARADAPDAYTELERIKNTILASDDVVYRDQFAWELKIIDDDETLNAFAAPGGFMYVYTGLIRFLDREDDLAGVLGHEIAHADRRHSTQQLTKNYGISALLAVILGDDPGLLAQLAAGLASLQFSRTDESEADAWSVRYLCDTDYAANGAAEFFRKLDGASGPAFLSTHPNPENRVEAIDALAEELGCSTEAYGEGRYQQLLDGLP